MEALINAYHDLPALIRLPLDFLFTVVFLRGIVANELLKEMKLYMKVFKTDRCKAIAEHWDGQARGLGHNSASVLACNQGGCTVFQGQS
jgi:hypothetical protein